MLHIYPLQTDTTTISRTHTLRLKQHPCFKKKKAPRSVVPLPLAITGTPLQGR